MDLPPARARRLLGIPQLDIAVRTIWIHEVPDQGSSRYQIVQQPESLCTQRRATGAYHSDVAAGRLKLATKPCLTGSLLTATIGMVAVACLAARAETGPPNEAITATRAWTNSAASSGNRGYTPSAQRNEMCTF